MKWTSVKLIWRSKLLIQQLFKTISWKISNSAPHLIHLNKQSRCGLIHINAIVLGKWDKVKWKLKRDQLDCNKLGFQLWVVMLTQVNVKQGTRSISNELNVNHFKWFKLNLLISNPKTCKTAAANKFNPRKIIRPFWQLGINEN